MQKPYIVIRIVAQIGSIMNMGAKLTMPMLFVDSSIVMKALEQRVLRFFQPLISLVLLAVELE